MKDFKIFANFCRAYDKSHVESGEIHLIGTALATDMEYDIKAYENFCNEGVKAYYIVKFVDQEEYIKILCKKFNVENTEDLSNLYLTGELISSEWVNIKKKMNENLTVIFFNIGAFISTDLLKNVISDDKEYFLDNIIGTKKTRSDKELNILLSNIEKPFGPDQPKTVEELKLLKEKLVHRNTLFEFTNIN